MAYSLKAAVKTVLQETETTWDTEIDDAIVSADALIDSLLAKRGLTVPSTTPQNIKDASAHFAAWLYRRRRDPAGAKAFEEEAKAFMDAYIGATLKKGIPFRSAEADST
jgi:hypothetical protein